MAETAIANLAEGSIQTEIKNQAPLPNNKKCEITTGDRGTRRFPSALERGNRNGRPKRAAESALWQLNVRRKNKLTGKTLKERENLLLRNVSTSTGTTA